MKKSAKMRSLFLSLLVCLGLVAASLPAQATLLVMPIWIIFKDRDRSANVTLVNTSDKEAVYQMSWRYQRQTETGAYEVLEAAENPETDVAKMVLFSPRQVTLQPGSKQRIRLSLRKPPDLPAGEYRAHLVLLRLGNDMDVPRPKAEKPGKLSLAINMNVGYSLPVIIRQGVYDAAARIGDDIQFVPASGKRPPQLEVNLTRSGTHGIFGKLTVFWTPPGGAEKQVGILNNVNIFSENTKRIAKVPLSEAEIRGGSVRIVYEGSGPDKGIPFDQKTFPVGG